MYENEGQELENESGVTEEAPPEPSTSEGQSEDGAQTQSSETKPDAANTPFHEHPRFKELIEQKNNAISAQKALEEKYAQLESQFQSFSKPKTEAQTDELIEHLKTIDPKFAARMEQLSRALPQVEQLQQKLQSYEQEQVRNQAVSQVNSLHEQNKVAPELRELINNQLDAAYMQGRIKNLSDLPGTYKAIHDNFSKYIDGVKRSERESYVSSKKTDSTIPTSQPKGKPASTASKKPSFSKDPELARQEIVSRYLKTAKAEADL